MNRENLKTIAYFIGQFPSPSHTYFWREVRALRGLGVSVDLVSTRMPQTALAPHAWVPEAIAQTEYLFPLSIRSFFECLLLIITAGPGRWLRCMKSIIQADGVKLTGRVRLAAMLFAGARLALSGRRHGWSHVHVALCADAANIALFAKLLTDLPYSLTLHSFLKEWGPNQRQKWGHAAFGTAVSQSLADELHKELGESVPNSLTIVPMGVDTVEFRRTNPYVPWNGDGAVRIFCAARLTPLKGQQDLLRAISLMRDHGVEVHLRLAGEDMDETKWFTGELQRLIGELDLTDQVDLLGPIAEDVVRSELETAHIFVLPSYAEGTSVAVMEAMAMGVPVVVTNVDGMPNLVEDGVDGLLVKPGAPEQLSERLQLLLGEPELAIKLSSCSRPKIERRFGTEPSARVLLKGIYGETKMAEPA
ncbi:MAG TPA: exopolysaccharide biosynthesis GT4 family glycosyltransferase EpsE [Candidatus Obscuribacterales bacterium]